MYVRTYICATAVCPLKIVTAETEVNWYGWSSSELEGVNRIHTAHRRVNVRLRFLFVAIEWLLQKGASRRRARVVSQKRNAKSESPRAIVAIGRWMDPSEWQMMYRIHLPTFMQARAEVRGRATRRKDAQDIRTCTMAYVPRRYINVHSSQASF